LYWLLAAEVRGGVAVIECPDIRGLCARLKCWDARRASRDGEKVIRTRVGNRAAYLADPDFAKCP